MKKKGILFFSSEERRRKEGTKDVNEEKSVENFNP